MPENLTFTHQILKEHTPDTLEGHTIVVLESTAGGGEKFRYQLQPGQEAKERSLLDRLPWRTQPRYFAYAVTATSFLTAQFGAPVKMDDMLHSFTLKIELTYSVSEPRLVVTERNRDPLKIVRDAIVGALQKRVAAYPWHAITNDFRGVEQQVVAEAVAAVRHIAASVGLRVQDIALSHDVPRSEIREKVIGDEHKVTLLIEQNKEEIAKYQRAAARFDAATQALNSAMQNAAGSVRTPAELIQALNSVNAFLQQMRGNDLGNFDSGSRTLTGAENNQMLLGAANQSGLAAVLIDVLSKTEQLHCPSAARRCLQAAVLHLIAELLPDERPDDAAVTKYRDAAADAASAINLTGPQSEYFERFIQPRNLREKLR